MLKINQKKIKEYPEFVYIDGTNKILKQMRNCICKVYSGRNGTGFFTHIPYNNGKMPVLITNYHVINENFIIQNQVIKLGLNDDLYDKDIKLNGNRKIYLDKYYDIAIIAINEEDKLNNDNFLELDDKLLISNSEEIYKTDNSIYIIQYPKVDKASVSYGIIKGFKGFAIYHLCCTDFGSSGSPILNLKTNKVIGIHKNTFEVGNYNGGIFLKEPIEKLKNNKIMKTIYEIKNSYHNNNNPYNNNFYNNHYMVANKDNDILNMISSKEYEENIKYFKNLENKKNKYKNGLSGIHNTNNFYDNEKKIAERSINDGIYNIIPMHCNHRAVDINGGSTENMANLQLYEYNNTLAQKFEIKYNYEEKYYTIRCLCSNKFLTVDYNNNRNIVQKGANNGFEQRWNIAKVGKNYEIISIMGELMDVNESKDAPGTNISCSLRTGKLNQQFQFKIPPPEYFPKTPYDGISIVDGLKAINAQSSFEYRKKIAQVNNIQDYEGTPKQNLDMLKMLKDGNLIKPVEC